MEPPARQAAYASSTAGKRPASTAVNSSERIFGQNLGAQMVRTPRIEKRVLDRELPYRWWRAAR